MNLPRFGRVRQVFRQPAIRDVGDAVARGMAGLQPGVRPGARVAVGVGSRGIARLPEIVRSLVEILRCLLAAPSLFPSLSP
ncbi:MAG: hypothetical protein ACKO3N_12100, partial [Verrucomicrobiota bacterium]